MDEVIEIEDRHYILAGSELTDVRTLVLKHGETFGIFNALGDIESIGHSAQGLFTEGMRHLSRFQLRLDGMRPMLLSSRVTRDNTRIIIDLTNPDIVRQASAPSDEAFVTHPQAPNSNPCHVLMPRGTLHLSRHRLLWENSCFEKLVLANFATHPVQAVVSLAFESDFADIFEVRGTERPHRGTDLPHEMTDHSVVLAYAGLDGLVRKTTIIFRNGPDRLTESEAHFHALLGPRERARFEFTICCEPASKPVSVFFADAGCQLDQSIDQSLLQFCQIDSSNEHLTAWLNRSLADIQMLMTQTTTGPYPYAGVPWFSAAFGRDGIITALQTLWVNPDIARGVLSYLAATQAQEIDPVRDAEPGKILHERRTDEMAQLGEVPFGRYYGSVDATPLFVALAGAYCAATGDLPFIEFLWPSIERALQWIDQYGDIDGDGFVEYQAKTAAGLTNQGWKDSHDSVFHADGSLAVGPIALCEVQGYVFDAKRRAAELAGLLGKNALAEQLLMQSNELQRRFSEMFWQKNLGLFALALDGENRPCAVRTSNPGHCLLSGIADQEQAVQIATNLLDPTMFTGWGVRTVASSEPRYNPMSYHNGSVWPHDNAMIAAGLARYGFRQHALRLFRSWLAASIFLDLHRLPELCCGFRRRKGKGPTNYPVACSPQAWAAGSVFMLLSACLGISIEGLQRKVHIHRPQLPKAVDEVRIRGMRIGEASIDLLFHRERRDVGVLVLRKDGPIDIVVTK